MPTIYRSLRVVDNGETVSVDVGGVEVDTPVVELRALVDRDELNRIGAEFDPASPSSPLAGESREIARPIVEDWTAPAGDNGAP